MNVWGQGGPCRIPLPGAPPPPHPTPACRGGKGKPTLPTFCLSSRPLPPHRVPWLGWWL